MTLQQARLYRIQSLMNMIIDWPDFKDKIVAKYGMTYGVSRRMTLEYLENLKSLGQVIETEDHILKPNGSDTN